MICKVCSRMFNIVILEALDTISSVYFIGPAEGEVYWSQNKPSVERKQQHWYAGTVLTVIHGTDGGEGEVHEVKYDDDIYVSCPTSQKI